MSEDIFNLTFNKITSNLKAKKVNLIAIHGPQGMGKTTLCKKLKIEFEKKSYKVIVFSIDDFYYKYDDMKNILKSYNNELYQYRGLAGTHDINLLELTLCNLLANKNTLIPTYDKTKYNGFGDRGESFESGESNNIIILEGWMIGYEPKNILLNELYLFNENLKLYKKVQDMVDIWIKFETNHHINIYKWRWSAEDKENGMNKETFNKFFFPYMKIYENYSVNGDKIIIDKDRNLLNF